MSDYGKLRDSFWTGYTGKRLRGHMEAQLLGLYLMKNPHDSMIGLYYLPLISAAHEVGLPLEGASKGLLRLIEEGYCAYDFDNEVVWVYEMAYQRIAEKLKANDNQVKGVIKLYENAPNCLFLSDFYEKYKDAFHLPARREYKTSYKPLRNPLQAPSKQIELKPQLAVYKNNDTHEDSKIEVATVDDMYDTDFNDFWDVWPSTDHFKRKKPQAAVAYRHAKEKTTPPILKATLTAQVEAEILMKRHNYKFIVSRGTPVNWLEGEGWLIHVQTEAEIIAGKPPLSAEERKKHAEIEEQTHKEQVKITQEKFENKQKERDEKWKELEKEVEEFYIKHWKEHYKHIKNRGTAYGTRLWMDWQFKCSEIDKKLGIPPGNWEIFNARGRKEVKIAESRKIVATIDWEMISLDSL